jgi:hypothetical protein
MQVLSIIKVGKNNGSFQKRSAPMGKISAICNGKGKKLFVIIVSVLGHPKGGRRLTSNFLHRGDLDVFWNDPIVYMVSCPIWKKIHSFGEFCKDVKLHLENECPYAGTM